MSVIKIYFGNVDSSDKTSATCGGVVFQKESTLKPFIECYNDLENEEEMGYNYLYRSLLGLLQVLDKFESEELSKGKYNSGFDLTLYSEHAKIIDWLHDALAGNAINPNYQYIVNDILGVLASIVPYLRTKSIAVEKVTSKMNKFNLIVKAKRKGSKSTFNPKQSTRPLDLSGLSAKTKRNEQKVANLDDYRF